jgi:oligoribonuclease
MLDKKSDKNLIWIDLEMTGLDVDRERIIEMAIIVTDPELNTLAESPVITVHQPDELLNAMDEWNTKQHGGSGLVGRVKASETSEAEAEQTMIDFLAAYVPAGVSPMCGNSVHQDRKFLHRYMPKLEAYFHYRNLDVSTLKELARRWRPDVLDTLKKQGSHLALDDIRDSIDELKHYRDNFLRMNP